MDAESILTLILGTGIFTLVGTYFLDRKGKVEDIQVEEAEKITSNVYSPLLFCLFTTRKYLEDISISLNQFQYYEEKSTATTGGYGSKADEDWLIESLRKYCKLFCSASIQEVLKTRIGFIKPLSFRREFFSYFQALSALENEIKDFSQVGFAREDDVEKKNKEVLWLEGLIDAVNWLHDVTTKFNQFIDDLLGKSTNQIKHSQYTTIFSKDDLNKMLQAISSHVNFGY